MLARPIGPSGRRCRRDVAILKSPGLLQRQVSSITAWPVSTLAVLAPLAGVPLAMAGRRAGAVRHRPWYLRAGCPGGRHTSDSPGSTLAGLGPSGPGWW